jgi:glycosyltransferase involved in cell wall biosynthesis
MVHSVPRASVVVAVRDDAERLRRCLAALRASSVELEIIVVDNESRDDSSAVASAYADRVASCSGSVAECHGLGAMLASTDVLVFVDADQVVDPDCVADAMEALRGADAVVIPERPLSLGSTYARVVASERRWSEWMGWAVP